MLPFRLLLLAVAFLLSPVPFPGEAEAEWGLEVTPYAGYTIGGNFEDNTTGADLDVKDGGNFGLVLGVPDSPETQYELFCGLQRMKVTGGGTFGGDTSSTWTATTSTWGATGLYLRRFFWSAGDSGPSPGRTVSPSGSHMPPGSRRRRSVRFLR